MLRRSLFVQASLQLNPHKGIYDMSKKIGLAFDMDDTLSPDTSTQLIESFGINPDEFWGKTIRAKVTTGSDPTLAYLHKIADLSGKGKPMGMLTLEALGKFGATIDPTIYPGVDGLRADLQAVAASIDPSIEVEMFVVSGGIKHVLDGSAILRRNFNAIYGNEFDVDPKTGVITRVKKIVTFAEKTKILFEINKGITPEQAEANPYLVNDAMPEGKRAIPFSQMIYCGDGLTDIACFSLVKSRGGYAFGIFNPAKPASAQRAFDEFIAGNRVTAVHAPRYGKEDELGSLLRAAVTRIAKRIAGNTTTSARLTPTD